LVWGVYELLFMMLVLGWLERRWPAEPIRDKSAPRLDMLFTCLHRLGLFPLIAFALLVPLMDSLEASLRWWGVSRPNIDQWLSIESLPWLSWLLYLLVFDLIDYWIHRFQHRWRWWWALHAVHHSQRQMTFWTDQRNHLLDDLIRDLIIAMAALLLGAAPSQFVAFVVLSRIVQSFQHVNALVWMPGWLQRLVVSPQFHRVHHAMGVGHEGRAMGCNFGVLFPWWDMIFRTADFDQRYHMTGIADQLEGRQYGTGFWSLHWLAILRMVGR
ncbi:MAG: sterol desaturase family protein, partial [Betaproteobacteria bacterium]|nr:sterol desaturase family protein [Betaproteobacteria bacterium]